MVCHQIFYENQLKKNAKFLTRTLAFGDFWKIFCERSEVKSSKVSALKVDRDITFSLYIQLLYYYNIFSFFTTKQ